MRGTYTSNRPEMANFLASSRELYHGNGKALQSLAQIISYINCDICNERYVIIAFCWKMRVSPGEFHKIGFIVIKTNKYTHRVVAHSRLSTTIYAYANADQLTIGWENAVIIPGQLCGLSCSNTIRKYFAILLIKWMTFGGRDNNTE